ncbi:GNAT family N-acetyltransferase [Hymenobacter sp. 5317J-9]|uniref:GNAT family N-acetyltransferase n=1 Tax=Hymenobacter sp. 5317J-9 TaxID=2932250 RepID=UPI001FD6BB38|nr:GNAT family N-acetyltransferase [Hymenobacter sp. 5317J-9]UOQ97047.1 GNAT family N-acetyltransferase [Hymenobacter sp. 5317J-9]
MSDVRLSVRENVLNTPGLVTFADYVDHLTRRGKGWVAEADGRTVGFAIADLQGHSIWALFVHPDFAGRGAGRMLHDAMLNWYFSQTAETVWLSTAPGTRAEAFYCRAGWQFLGLLASGEAKFEMTMSLWQNQPHENA